MIGSLSKYELMVDATEESGGPSQHVRILPRGDFVIDELPPGKHRLGLVDSGVSGPKEVGFTEVNLVNQNVPEVVITPFKAAQVRVRVVMEGEEDKPFTPGSVWLTPDHSDESSSGTLVQHQPRMGHMSLMLCHRANTRFCSTALPVVISSPFSPAVEPSIRNRSKWQSVRI